MALIILFSGGSRGNTSGSQGLSGSLESVHAAQALPYGLGALHESQAVRNSTYDIRGSLALLSSLGVEASLGCLHSLGTGDSQALLNLLCLNNLASFGIMTPLGEGRCETLLTSICSDCGNLGILQRIPGLSGEQSLRLQVSAGCRISQALRGLLTETGVQASVAATLQICERNPVSGSQSARNSLRDTQAVFPAVEWDILLDGVSIKGRVKSANISMVEGAAHNEISIETSDAELYFIGNPATGRGNERIRVDVGGRSILFLLEDRSGAEESYSLWGRSISAKDDSPYVDDMDYVLETPTLASEVAASLLVYNSLDWQCSDWVLPDSYEFYGTPIEGIKRIADAIGAIVRSEDDGTILVRKEYPVRPVDIQTETPATVLTRDVELIELQYQANRGTGFNAIEVRGASANIQLPLLELEEAVPLTGESVHVRVYRTGHVPFDTFDTYVTDGSVQDLGEHTEDLTETVVFFEGNGTLSRPVISIISVDWIGEPGGEVSYSQYSDLVTINEQGARVAQITFRSEYRRYLLLGHNVSTLVFVLAVGSSSDVDVLIKTGAGDSLAEMITEPLLTTEAAAVERGKAWLDANKYDNEEMDILAPYQDEIVDGAIARVDDGALAINGNCHISGVDIIFDGPRVLNRVMLRIVDC